MVGVIRISGWRLLGYLVGSIVTNCVRLLGYVVRSYWDKKRDDSGIWGYTVDVS